MIQWGMTSERKSAFGGVPDEAGANFKNEKETKRQLSKRDKMFRAALRISKGHGWDFEELFDMKINFDE